MIIKEILNKKITPLETNDSIAFALTKMDLMHTTRFAVVDNNGKLVGMASLPILIEKEDESLRLTEVELTQSLYVPETQHLFEAARRMLTHELYVLPVVDSEMNFKGVVIKNDVIIALSELFNIASYGSVITIEIAQNDFTITDIIRIIENEGAKILGIAVQQPSAEYPSYRVSIKLNLEDSSVVSSALRRFDYNITSEASSETLEHNYADRADELIRYLDI